MSRLMREKVLSARVRAAAKQGSTNPGGWADVYAKDVTVLKRLLVRFVVADAARAIAMDDYPGLSKAEKVLFETRLRAQRWLGANVEWNGPR
jgi:hypothetical protein